VEATVEANRDGHGGLAGWPSVEGYRLNRKAGLVIEPDVARLLRAREKATGSGTVMVANDLAGYSAVVTKSSPDGFLVFGDWSQVLPMEWGIVEVGVDFYGVNSAYSREDSSACAPFGYAMWSASNRRVCEDHEHHMMEYEANQRQQVQSWPSNSSASARNSLSSVRSSWSRAQGASTSVLGLIEWL